MVAKAVGAFGSSIETPGEILANAAADIEGAAQETVAPCRQRDLTDVAAKARLLAHAVDQPTAGTAAVQHARRSAQDFDAFDVAEIAVVRAVVAEAVQVLVEQRAEATDVDLVAAPFAH